jgi:methionyl-tRNA formyltransferase
MRILCIGYRQWALDIYSEIQKNSDYLYLIINSYEKYSDKIIYDFKPDYILFYGWSWIVSKEIINNYKCIMLHPSPLPKYRGGSPIQNQIINNEKDSMVTLFLMTDNLDDGDIIAQHKISLEGHLNDIFKRITQIGIKLTIEMLKGNYSLIQQDNTQATYCKRRKSSESEITIDELQTKSSEYLFNKIRMLEAPYPNAYIDTIDGKKLMLKYVEVEDE